MCVFLVRVGFVLCMLCGFEMKLCVCVWWI